MKTFRSFLQEKLPNFDPSAENAKEIFRRAFQEYYSHGLALAWTQDDADVIWEYGQTPSEFFEFSENQVNQIHAVIEAAQNLLNVLTTPPKYMSHLYPEGYEAPNNCSAALVADIVADYLCTRMDVFFPTNAEDGDVAYLSDYYG